MRIASIFLLVSLFACRLNAQDTTIVISNAMFKANGMFYLLNESGWLFKPGNDVHFADTSNDKAGWTKLDHFKIIRKHIDKNGRFEGWFRINVLFDSSFANDPPGIAGLSWGATDVYIDGNNIASFGETGTGGKPFVENRPNRKLAVPTTLTPGIVYTLTLHYVDHFDPFSVKARLTSEEPNTGIHKIIVFTNEAFDGYQFRRWTKRSLYDGLLPAVSSILSLLFWLLFSQNRAEKNIRRFAIGSSLIALLSLSEACSYLANSSFLEYSILNYISTISVLTYFFYTPVILAGVFERKKSKIISTLLVCSAIASLIALVLTENFFLVVLMTAIPLALSLYYLFSQWRKIRGGQWAIVIGFLLSFIFLILFLVVAVSNFNIETMYFVIVYTFAPPIAMVIFVVLRFKEMLAEVRRNTAQVVQLSEERRTNAENQQKILTEEVAKQTAELRNTLSDLKAAQSQLIQSEKMASLGELTAGIAHEIQNPLNFVNNFSEVNQELAEELINELAIGNLQLATEITGDIRDNSEKINHHGKRADAIVKGMLQHSQSGKGQKELTNINALADEYSRLAYRGLRAKDNFFNVTMKTDFDESIGNINIIPQDIGRVLLNLYNNSFYAVAAKAASYKLQHTSYEPTVSVSTKKLGDRVEIRVTDNGNGIPQNIVDKIFQPFFTTKPTGQGTGLGLSLSYDIIKAHGGEIKVNSKKEEGSEFIVQLLIA